MSIPSTKLCACGHGRRKHDKQGRCHHCICQQYRPGMTPDDRQVLEQLARKKATTERGTGRRLDGRRWLGSRYQRLKAKELRKPKPEDQEASA